MRRPRRVEFRVRQHGADASEMRPYLCAHVCVPTCREFRALILFATDPARQMKKPPECGSFDESSSRLAVMSRYNSGYFRISAPNCDVS